MAAVVFDEVTRCYERPPRTVLAVDRVSFDVDEGERLTVLGRTRAGKSTLLRLAAGLELPDDGAVRLLGRDTRSLSGDEQVRLLRREVALVRPAAGEGSVAETLSWVAWPLLSANVRSRRASAAAREALREVGAEDCAGALLCELSSGELARVSLAQALVRRPQLLLADDPAGGLDPDERSDMLALLDDVAARHGMAVLATAVDSSCVLRGSRVASMHRGRMLVRPRPAGEVHSLDERRRRPAG